MPRTELKVLFLANSPRSGASAKRAVAFASRLSGEMQTIVEFRQGRRITSFFGFLQVALTKRPDVIYAVDMAVSGVAAALFLRFFIGTPFVLDTGDIAVEVAKSGGRRGWCGVAATALLEYCAQRFAALIVVRGSFHKDLLETKFRVPVVWVPDGVNLKEVEFRDNSLLRQKLNLKGQFVVGVVGSMVWSEKYKVCYGWDLLEALGQIGSPSIVGLFVGDGDGRKILEERATGLGIADRCRFVGTVEFELLSEYISLMDICLSTQSNDLVGRVRTTGKLPLYLACNRYVIATAVGEAARLVPEIGRTLAYAGVRDDTYPARLAQAIAEAIRKPEELQRGARGRSIAEREFDYDSLSGRVATAIKMAMGESSSAHS